MDTERSVRGVIGSKRDGSATRALVLGIFSLLFGILAPFAIWAGVASLWRIRASKGALTGEVSAALGALAGMLGAAALIVGTVYWFLAS